MTHLTTAVLKQLPPPANPPLPSVLLQLAKKKTNTCPHGEPPPQGADAAESHSLPSHRSPYFHSDHCVSTQGFTPTNWLGQGRAPKPTGSYSQRLQALSATSSCALRYKCKQALVRSTSSTWSQLFLRAVISSALAQSA